MSVNKCRAIKRKAEKTCFCRACSVPMEKGTELVYFYSIYVPRIMAGYGQGQHIYLCLECCNFIGLIANVEAENETDSLSDGNPFMELVIDY